MVIEETAEHYSKSLKLFQRVALFTVAVPVVLILVVATPVFL